MTQREDVARAMAFFDTTDDIMLLHQLVAEIAPRAKRIVGTLLARGTEEAIPPPAELRPARTPANRDEAVKILRATNDFALLQVLARSVGRRVEAIEIAASADFPEGVRVVVPARVAFPPAQLTVEGTVERTGTMLSVLLDNGETWEGPPTLARLVTRR